MICQTLETYEKKGELMVLANRITEGLKILSGHAISPEIPLQEVQETYLATIQNLSDYQWKLRSFNPEGFVEIEEHINDVLGERRELAENLRLQSIENFCERIFK